MSSIKVQLSNSPDEILFINKGMSYPEEHYGGEDGWDIIDCDIWALYQADGTPNIFAVRNVDISLHNISPDLAQKCINELMQYALEPKEQSKYAEEDYDSAVSRETPENYSERVWLNFAYQIGKIVEPKELIGFQVAVIDLCKA